MSNRIKSLFALIFIVFVSACESGGDESPTTSLVGTWTAVSFSADVQSTSSFNGTNISSSSVTTGSDFNYDVTFTETAFTTSGSYTVNSTISVNGGDQQTITSEVTGVSGSGTYISTAEELTLSGSFYDLELNGLPVQAEGQAQTASYEITSNGELIISQDETITLTQSGVSTTVSIVAASRWTRK